MIITQGRNKLIFSILLVSLVFNCYPVHFQRSIQAHFLSPKTSLGQNVASQWAQITEGENYYFPHELQNRINAIKKALPLLKRFLGKELKVVAIYATGEYIEAPSWQNEAFPLPPDKLEFVVLVRNSNEIILKENIEISPQSFFDTGDLGYDSAYHMEVLVIGLDVPPDLTTDIFAKIYYFGALLEGDGTLLKEPPLEAVQNILSDLLTLSGEYQRDLNFFSFYYAQSTLISRKIIPQLAQRAFTSLGPSDASILPTVLEFMNVHATHQIERYL